MTENRTIGERISNRIFAIPAVAQWWAKATSGRTEGLVELSAAIPFARLQNPLADCKVALVTTSGVHLRGQTPFDMQNPDGDATYRELPADTAETEIVITHKYYDHSDADADLNVVFPLAHFRNLAQMGIIGEVAPRHFGFMGHIEGDQVQILNEITAPEIATKLRDDGVDFAFLTPA